MPKILACLDASAYASSVCELAAWIASRRPSTIELLHVVQRKSAVTTRHDLTGAIGLGAKGDLLEELTRIEEAQAKMAVQSGRALLSTAEQQLRTAGVDDITTTHRHGGIVETILEREADCDLIIMGKRGASREFAATHLGSKIERVLRASKRPIFIAPLSVGPIEKVVIAFDGGPSATRGLDLVLDSPVFEGLETHVIMAGQDNDVNRRRLDAVRKRFADAHKPAVVTLEDNPPEHVIVESMNSHTNSILVMGAYGHSPLRNLIVGSTTTSIIRTVSVPVLLIR